MDDLKALLEALEQEWPQSSVSITDLRRIVRKSIAVKAKEEEKQERILDDALNDAMSDKAYGSGD